MYERVIKRSIDIVASGIGLAVLALPMVAVAAITKLDSPGPVFFKQKRVGKNKTHFDIVKFRSMSVNAPKDTPTHELKGPDEYLTPWQRFIRKSSIDELPQLYNILIGDMSIVGPRPALWNQFDLIAERDRYGANDIKPGLTGLAQINGRDELDIQTKARLDGEYAANISFKTDMKCIIGTVYAVLRRDGVVEGGTGSLISSDKQTGDAT
jgi:O-antigen biosynthesis protein WbqP